NVQWKVKIPGVAWSSPVIWGDRVFVTTAITDKQTKPRPGFGGGGFGGGAGFGGGRPGGGRPPGGGGGGFGGMRDRPPPNVMYRWKVMCLNRNDGKVMWEQTAAEKKPTIATHSTNTYASETPVTDGERVYAYFGMTGLYCFDVAGKKVWEKSLGSYKMMMSWGTGSSPVLVGDRLIIQCANEEKSFLIAFNKKTGDELWKVPRTERSSWSTPFIWKTKNRTEIVCAGARRVRSYDPENGKQLWELGGLEGQASASPVADEERLFV